jgi:hypothetical protein
MMMQNPFTKGKNSKLKLLIRPGKKSPEVENKRSVWKDVNKLVWKEEKK